MSDYPTPTSKPKIKSGTKIATIGFVASEFDSIYSGQFIARLRSVCKQLGVRLVVFTGRALQSAEPQERCRNVVYELISKHRLDGLLAATSWFGVLCEPEQIKEELSKLSLPVVTLGMPLPDTKGVDINDALAVELAMNHLASHGYKRIAFVSGEPNSFHFRNRLDSYRKWIAEHGADLGIAELIFSGDGSAKSGYDFMESISSCSSDYVEAEAQQPGSSLDALKNAGSCERSSSRPGTSACLSAIAPYSSTPLQDSARHAIVMQAPVLLDAVCFASDLMAIGAMEFCEAKGIKVPGDLAFIGIDDFPILNMITPKLSSVSHDTSELARLAVQLLLSESENQHFTVSAKLIERQTCGCSISVSGTLTPTHNTILRDLIYRDSPKKTSLEELRFEQLQSRAMEFLLQTRLRFFYAAVFEFVNASEDGLYLLPSPASRILMGYESGLPAALPERFHTFSLLPDDIWERLTKYDLAILPLCFEHSAYGYLVVEAAELNNSEVEELRLMTSVALSSEKIISELQLSHKQATWALGAMNSVNRQLTDISLKDDLTGLFNRRGLMQEAAMFINTRPERFLLGFADMNGLKQINDRLGHDEGDEALRAVAKLIRACCREGDIIARVSGDEFVFLLKDMGAAQQYLLEKRFKDQALELNRRSQKPYSISVAVGYAIGGPDSNLEEMLVLSDARMYAKKAEHKKSELA